MSLNQQLATQWASQETLNLLLESAPIAIVTTNQYGQILFVNARLEEMLGYSRAELMGQNVEVLLPQSAREIHIQHRTEYVAHPRVRAMGSGLNLAARRKDGTEFPIEVGLSYITINEQLLIMGSITDISLRKHIADILELQVKKRTQELERRRQVAAGLRDILAILNSNRSREEILDTIVGQAGRLLDAKASAIYRLLDKKNQLTIESSQGLPEKYISQADIPLGQGASGKAVLTRQPVVTPNLTTVVEENAAAQLRRKTLLESGYRAVLAVPLLVKDGAYGGLTLYYDQPRNFSTEEIELAVTFADQAALAIENARLHTQIEHSAAAAERSRLARDLHDAVTQTLFSASLIAEVLPRLWERNREEGTRRLEELQQLTRGALAEMRTLLLELRPARLTQVALKELLRQLTEAIGGRARVPITLTVYGECNLPPDVQVSLYRTAQEALNNVAKHAQASQAQVELTCTPNRAKLVIKDNGRGFKLDGIAPEHLGLTIMHERADAIGAKLSIKSSLGQGTEVSVVWNGITKRETQ